MGYRNHGFVPSDEDVHREGYKAFPPKGDPIRPGSQRKKDGIAAVFPCQATGDPQELAAVAEEVAAYWPGNPYASMARMMGMMYGCVWDDEDDPGTGFLI